MYYVIQSLRKPEDLRRFFLKRLKGSEFNMSSNSMGNIFKITTWGESHGKALGVVIDGCPAGLPLNEGIINQGLAKRAAGVNAYVSPRKEKDLAEIYSGVFEGKTTGAPISIIIHNHDVDSSKYEPIKDILRPGHANYTYLKKYGCFDYRGGGRASARETVCRVAAGVVAEQLLIHLNIQINAYIQRIGSIAITEQYDMDPVFHERIASSDIFCPDQATESMMKAALQTAIDTGDSLGGVVEFQAIHLPVGLGDPVYEKLEANLAKAMLSLPASKGFEIGEGFLAATMQGSSHNDVFIKNEAKIITTSNHAGGTLGGISTGMPLIGRVAFKPTSSIKKPQASLSLTGEATDFQLPEGSRHDPCVAIRAVPIVKAMCALVIVDALLLNCASQLSHISKIL
jgi:chorismate synthase